MTYPRPQWIAALVVVALASPLRADYMYSWSSPTTTIMADSPGTGFVTLKPDPGTGLTLSGSSDVVARRFLLDLGVSVHVLCVGGLLDRGCFRRSMTFVW